MELIKKQVHIPELKDLMDILIEAVYDNTPVIAGGYVRDYLLGRPASDIDVFILGGEKEKEKDMDEFLEEKRQSLTHFLTSKGFNIKENTVWFHKFEPFLLENYTDGNYTVQVMWSFYNSIYDLLDSIDFTISQGALQKKETDEFDLFGSPKFFDHINYTYPDGSQGVYLEIHKITYPCSTLKRGIRFSRRYLVPFPEKEINKVINHINQKKKEQA